MGPRYRAAAFLYPHGRRRTYARVKWEIGNETLAGKHGHLVRSACEPAAERLSFREEREIRVGALPHPKQFLNAHPRFVPFAPPLVGERGPINGLGVGSRAPRIRGRPRQSVNEAEEVGVAAVLVREDDQV